MSEQKNMQEMLKSFMQNAQEMQAKMQEEYKKMAERNKTVTVSASSGANDVTATVNLSMEMTALEVKPEIKSGDAEVMKDLIIGAVNAALKKAQDQVKAEMIALNKKIGVPGDLPIKGE